LRRRQSSSSRHAFRTEVEERAGGVCEYCHAPQRATGYRFHLEHIIPSSKGGSDDLPNRALACASCNLAKTNKMSGVDPLTGEEVALFNPRTQVWDEHFRWATNQQTLEGLTNVGRATIAALSMNSQLYKEARQLWFGAELLP
jgi:hypothetical protein